MKWIGRIFILAVVALLAVWLWQRLFVSEETRVKTLIASMERAVQTGNFVRLADGIAGDYRDDRGLDKPTLLAYVRAARAQYQSLFIHITDLTIELADDRQQAHAVLIARVLASPRAGAAQTELFTERFRLHFRKTDQGWKLVRAESPELKFD
jgi:ketosteroid isomerase-like protein